MSTVPDPQADPTRPPVNPRPGVVKTLGIFNIVISVMLGVCLLVSSVWLVAMMSGQGAAMKVEVRHSIPPAPAGTRPMIAFNPLMGMDDPGFIRFWLVDASTGLVLNGLMFATGIGLLNLKGWAGRWWTALAWIKIGRLILLWGVYIIAVAPSLSGSMARNVTSMIQQTGGQRRMLTVDALFRFYSIMNLILAVSMIVFGSIYPAISLWVLGRSGVKAAMVDRSPLAREPENP